MKDEAPLLHLGQGVYCQVARGEPSMSEVIGHAVLAALGLVAGVCVLAMIGVV